MLPSLVCYADILGYSQTSKSAISHGEGQEYLTRIYKALSKAYNRIRNRRKETDEEALFDIKVFTDNIVIGYPLLDPKKDFGEPEFGDILHIFFKFQLSLAMEGFLIRGGVACGNFYMNKDIVYGDALLEAFDQDKSGGPPRITLGPSAVKIVRRHLAFYSSRKEAPHYHELLEDTDGKVFLNYLCLPFDELMDMGILFGPIRAHKKTIEDGLKKYKGIPDVRAKYEWLARYHNYICTDYLGNVPNDDEEEYNEDYEDIYEDIRKLQTYKINIEELAAFPKRISIKPLRR
jgi:hypothetical protein